MATDDLDLQVAWDALPLRARIPTTPDSKFAVRRLLEEPMAALLEGASGRVLEVAAADAGNAIRLIEFGDVDVVALEPSPIMLAKAAARMATSNGRLRLVRGIAEALPFPDGTFDRVLCDSAIDHFADPERGLREMARVTKPDGRLVVAFVNYAGWTPRACRRLYAVGRALHLVAPEAPGRKLPWDTPVPYEHTFEATLDEISGMAAPYLELEQARGVSLGWMFPGWGALLARSRFLRERLPRIDRFAFHRPRLADFIVTIWRPKPVATWPLDDYRVRSTNPVYRRLIRDEAAYWAKADFGTFFGGFDDVTAADRNTDLTGEPTRTWLADLAARGPFTEVAVLGCDDTRWDAAWLDANGSPRLDVYELDAKVIDAVKSRLGARASRVRFIASDLNFVELPELGYDCVWTSGTLSSLVNLEHVVAQVKRALRPGGLFAFHGWVGEPRLQYDQHRIDCVNAVLANVPATYRRQERCERPTATLELSPFAAVRSNDVLPLLTHVAGFDVVHVGTSGWLFPLTFLVDAPALARDRPDLLALLRRAETEARSDPALRPVAAYVVLRKRATEGSTP